MPRYRLCWCASGFACSAPEAFVVDMGVGLDHFRRMHRWEAIGPLVAGIAGRMGQAVTPLARLRTSLAVCDALTSVTVSVQLLLDALQELAAGVTASGRAAWTNAAKLARTLSARLKRRVVQAGDAALHHLNKYLNQV